MSEAADLERKPAIALRRARELNPEHPVLKGLKAGIEEEGVPWQEIAVADNGSSQLAREGSEWSQLGVGIGVDSQGSITVHFHRLGHSEPLFSCQSTEATAVKAFTLGANAARLVKGIPFREI